MAKKNGGKNKPFSLSLVRTSSDIPDDAWLEVKKEFGGMRLLPGEIPDTGGNVCANRPLKFASFHPRAVQALRGFEVIQRTMGAA